MLVIHNPVAGKRRAHLLWRVLDIMAMNGLKVDLAEMRHPGHAVTLAREAVALGKRTVVAAGGDGTVAEVARGLEGSDCRLGVIPLGTANVFAKELELPATPSALAAALAFGRTRQVWPGVMRQNGPGRPAGETLFVQMLGAGFDAQVVHRMPPMLKQALGPAAYVAQGVRELARYRFAPIRVVVDGVTMQLGSVIVTKGHFYGGRFALAPGASPHCPGFTVAAFERAGPWAAMLSGLALPLGQIGRVPGLRLLRATEVEIETDQVPAQTDGDPAGVAPLIVKNARRPIDILVPGR